MSHVSFKLFLALNSPDVPLSNKQRNKIRMQGPFNIVDCLLDTCCARHTCVPSHLYSILACAGQEMSQPPSRSSAAPSVGSKSISTSVSSEFDDGSTIIALEPPHGRVEPKFEPRFSHYKANTVEGVRNNDININNIKCCKVQYYNIKR